MSILPAALFEFDFFEPLPIQVEVSDAPLTSDAGPLPLGQFDKRIGLTTQFAAVLDDPRDPELTEHTFLEMVRSRVFGILAGYEDQNDHDTLRTDPVFKLIADRAPEEDDLASQPTLSRFENQINIASLRQQGRTPRRAQASCLLLPAWLASRRSSLTPLPGPPTP